MQKLLPFVAIGSAMYGWLLGVLLLVFWVAKAPRLESGLTLSVVWRDWFARRWQYSTALPGLVGYQPGRRSELGEEPTRTERHENVHKRQIQDCCAYGLLLGTVLVIFYGSALAGYLAWVTSPVMLLTNILTSGIRYGWKHAYRQSEHERSAYAQTDRPARSIQSWDERRSF